MSVRDYMEQAREDAWEREYEHAVRAGHDPDAEQADGETDPLEPLDDEEKDA